MFIRAPRWLREQTLSQARPAVVATTGTAGTGAHAVGQVAARLSMVTGRFALWAVAVVAVPAIALGVTVGWPTLDTVPVPSVPDTHAVHATLTSQDPKPPAPASITPLPPSNVPVPPSNTSAPPPVGPANPNNPSIDNRGEQPVPQASSPAPTATVSPPERTVTPTSHVPSAAPASPVAPPVRQQPTQPPVKHCPNGDTVGGGQSCPSPQAPVQPNCPHVNVQGGPICGRTSSGG